MNSHINSLLTEQIDNVPIYVDKGDTSISEKIDKPGTRNSIDSRVERTSLSHDDDVNYSSMKSELNAKLEEKNKKPYKPDKNNDIVIRKDRSPSPKSEKRKKNKRIPFDPTKLSFLEVKAKNINNMADDGTIISEITTEDDLHRYYKHQEPSRKMNV
jgi:hypothetical protein